MDSTDPSPTLMSAVFPHWIVLVEPVRSQISDLATKTWWRWWAHPVRNGRLVALGIGFFGSSDSALDAVLESSRALEQRQINDYQVHTVRHGSRTPRTGIPPWLRQRLAESFIAEDAERATIIAAERGEESCAAEVDDWLLLTA